MRVRCLESGRATGLHFAPKRRIRCIICDRLVQLREFGEHIIVPVHYVPQDMQRVHGLLARSGKVFEGTF